MNNKYLKFLLILCASILTVSVSEAKEVLFTQFQFDESFRRMEKNLDASDVMPGAIIASPSKHYPNYYFHWIRDAALTMQTYVQLRSTKTSIADERMTKWVEFESKLQNLNTMTGLGEPKYNVDGTAFDGPWGRPQNDGPALRARTTVLWLQQLMKEGDLSVVRKLTGENSFVKKDLDYTMNHWREASFDVWEEIKGDHFFTKLAQAKSLKEAAQLYRMLGNNSYADKLTSVYKEIYIGLKSFWNSQDARMYPTLNMVDGWSHKKSNLDVQVILASLYLTEGNEIYSVMDDRIISTMYKLKESFHFYGINQYSRIVSIGRYPEDVYDGVGFDGGNPWFIATAGYAQAQCRIVKQIKANNRIEITSLNVDFYREYVTAPHLIYVGDVIDADDERFSVIKKNMVETSTGYFKKILNHGGRDGQLDEQYSRHNGYMQGAKDLTWSHAAFIKAHLECESLMGPFKL